VPITDPRGQRYSDEREHNSKGMKLMSDAPISRGFKARRQEQIFKNRLPPGQYVTHDFPILSAGPTPQTRIENWNFSLQSGGSLLGKWNWQEFEALPQTTLKTDIHCVTKWSKFDTTWQGVTFDDLLEAAGLSEATMPYVMASWRIATAAIQQMFRSRTSLEVRE